MQTIKQVVDSNGEITVTFTRRASGFIHMAASSPDAAGAGTVASWIDQTMRLALDCDLDRRFQDVLKPEEKETDMERVAHA
jgi:hypothetical protein